jgi:hypothetical protein
MTARIGFRCSAVLAILVVVATAGNIWAGWVQKLGPEDFAPDPGWDTYIYGIPEGNTMGVTGAAGSERMTGYMPGVYFGAWCMAAPPVAQLAPLEDVEATCIVRMELLTQDLYPGLILRGNNLDDMIDLSGSGAATTGTAYAYVVSGHNEVAGSVNMAGIYAMYYEPGELQPDHNIGLLEGITLSPWDTTDLINQDIYMKFSAVTTPEGKVQLDGMMSTSSDFSNPFGVISRLDDPLGDATSYNDALVGAGQVGVAAMNAVGEGPIEGRAVRAKWDDVAVYKYAGPGDANGDGSVDDTDASILGANWLKQSGATWGMGDFNEDGKVNDKDAAIMAANWAPAGGGSSVPEPGTLVLLASAAVALCFRRRR